MNIWTIAIVAFVTQTREKQLALKGCVQIVCNKRAILIIIFKKFNSIFVHFYSIGDAGKCVKGLSYRDDCNACVCNPKTGETACTQIPCPPGNNTVSNPNFLVFFTDTFGFWTVDIGKCSKGLTFMDHCNTCICDPNTGESVCTKVACPRNKKKFIQLCLLS